jgi:2-oxoglutarate dehydrogenase E1 component
MASGGFREVLSDPDAPAGPEKVIFCSGKICYELFQRRKDLEAGNIAIVRLEQLYPFPETQLSEIMEGFDSSPKCLWVQEEPENMGAWRFVRQLFYDKLKTYLEYIGRKPYPSSATGYPGVFKKEQNEILAGAIPDGE